MVRILIVDDDDNFRVYLTHILSKEFDAEILEAENGRNGLLSTFKLRPDLIILDDDMPEMRGDEFMLRISTDSKLSKIPVIMMTASNDNDTLGRYLNYKIADYIIKPFDSGEAIKKIKKVIEANKKTVMIVDDNRAFRLFAQKVIRSKFNKCDILLAENGNDAIKLIGDEKPDLILLDNAMPEMDGKEFLKIIRSDANYKDISVIMLSCQSGKEIIQEVTDLGITDYILKPVTLQDLYVKLNQYLN